MEVPESENYFMWYKPLYEEAIKRYLCGQCKHFGADGVCRGPDPRGCALFRYLPKLVMIAEGLKDAPLDLYAERVRREVPMKCQNPDPKGPCPLRDTLDCGLDEYLPFVMLAVKEVDALLEETAHREGF